MSRVSALPAGPFTDLRQHSRTALLPLTLVALVAFSRSTGGAAEPPIAVVGGTVYTAVGPPIRDGVVLIEAGKIVAVGPRSEVEIPDGARRLRATGRAVIPGLVEIGSSLVLEGGASEARSTTPYLDVIDAIDPFHPLVRMLREAGTTTVGLAPDSGPSAGGLGVALKLAPATDAGDNDDHAGEPRIGELSGQLRVLRRLVCLTLDLCSSQRGLGTGSTTTADRLKKYYQIRKLFTGAQAYEKQWKDYREKVLQYNEEARKWRASRESGDEKAASDEKIDPEQKAPQGEPAEKPEPKEKADERRREELTDLRPDEPDEPDDAKDEEETKKPEAPKKPAEKPAKKPAEKPKPPSPPNRPKVNEALEVLLRALDGELPVWMRAHREDSIGYAVRLKEEFDLDVTILGGSEAYDRASRLKEAEIPVVVSPVLLRQRGLEVLRHRESNPAELAAAGVPVSIASLEGEDLASRFLRWQAAVAVRGGLPADAALRAITLENAQRLGVADRVGSLEAGKDADLVILDGDPLDATSRVVRVLVDGEIVMSREQEF